MALPDRRWAQVLTDLTVELRAGLASDDEQAIAADLLDDLAVILADSGTVDESVVQHVRAAEHLAARKIAASR